MQPIPYGRQHIEQKEIDAVVATLQADFLTQGPKVAEFEAKFAAYVDVSYAVAVSTVNGTSFNAVCCVYPCAPFVSSKGLIESYSKLIKEQLDVVFPVLRYSFPIQRTLKIEGNKAMMFTDAYRTSRSQDLEPSYHDAGQFYWALVGELFNNKSLLTDNTGVIEISELEGQDIDTPIDWKLAELKYTVLHANE